TPGNTDEVVAANPVGKAALPTRAFVHDKDGTLTVIDALGPRDARWNKPGQAVLGEKMADFLGVKAGDEHTVRFADGATVKLRIAQVLPDDPARGDFVMSRQLVREHDPAALTDDIFVPLKSKPTSVVPGTAVHDAVRFAFDDYATDAKLTDSLAVMLIVIAVGYSGIAVANSMALTAHGRRRDFAVMKSAGSTVRQLLLFSATEATLVVAVGAALGVLVTLGPLAGMASGLSQATSTDIGLHLNLSTIAGDVVGGLPNRQRHACSSPSGGGDAGGVDDAACHGGPVLVAANAVRARDAHRTVPAVPGRGQRRRRPPSAPARVRRPGRTDDTDDRPPAGRSGMGGLAGRP
ncbi:ABC transporter permease, partial [Streptomyces sp. NPDC059744]|uniref:ABC transporter permease n=1 Tax=Streptomyces sp. NPDC059744 TaxID=3346929 RepID=UPI00366484CE